LLAINASVPATTLQEFLAYAASHQQQLLFASAGNGTMVHLAGALFNDLAHVNVLAIQYRGGTEAALAVLRGEAQFTFGSLPGILPHTKSGQMKALAVASSKRLEAAPDLPTAAEAGLPGMEAEQWVALMAPARTPDTTVAQLNHDIRDVLNNSELKEVLKAQGAEVVASSPEELASFITSERSRLGRLIQSAHISID
jgi:tripartite-type tricarboxylate transporter receptor subunit TctC